MSDDKPEKDGADKAADDAAKTLLRSIAGAVERLRDLQDLAREQGIFVADREIVSCPRCGLVEDVLSDGRLITSREHSPGRDAGLRFVEDPEGSGRFTCPECGDEAVPDEA